MSARTRRLLACLLVLSVASPLGLVPGVPRAHAQDGQASKDNKMKEVKKACAAGEVDRAINLLAELYAETNDPIAIYNQARCYQGNGQPERAASRFREYLRKAKDLSPEERAEVEGFIKEADAEAAKQPPAGPAPPPPAAVAPAPAPAPVPQSPPPYYYAPPPGYAPPPPRPVKTSRRKGMMIAGFITLGVSYGLTALTGAVMRTDEIQADCLNCGAVGDKFLIPVLGPWLALGDAKKAGDDQEDFESLALTAGVAQGIGAALTTIGIILFSTSGPKATAATPTVTGMAVLPTRGGALGSLHAVF